MNENFIKQMMELAVRLNKFEIVRMQKCEICGPILRGGNPSKYPKCKKHGLL